MKHFKAPPSGNACCCDCGAILPADDGVCSACHAGKTWLARNIVSSVIGLLLAASVSGAIGAALTVWGALLGSINPVAPLILKGIAALLATMAFALALFWFLKK